MKGLLKPAEFLRIEVEEDAASGSITEIPDDDAPGEEERPVPDSFSLSTRVACSINESSSDIE